MDILDTFFKKYAYRFDKGYPDMDNKEDVLLLESLLSKVLGSNFKIDENQLSLFPDNEVKQIKQDTGIDIGEVDTDAELTDLLDRLKQNKYSPSQIKSIINKLDVFNNEEELSQILTAAQVTDASIGVNAINDIISTYLASTQDLDKFIENHKKNPLTYSDLPATGNLIAVINRHTGIDIQTIENIINIKGQEDGRGVGKGEAALALFFNDVLKSTGDGDNIVNGKPLEVKGTGGRLGKRGREASRNTSLLQKVDNTVNITNTNRFDIFIPQLLQDNIPPREVYNSLKAFVKEYYPSANPVENFLNIEDLGDQTEVRKAMQKIYASNYLNSLEYDQVIFINTIKQPGTYYKFDSRDALYTFIDQNTTVFSSPIGVVDLDPQVFVK